MAFPPNSSGSSGGAYGTRGVSGDKGSTGLALDNMIRNQLKVSDPRNPKQVADALLNYYQDLPQAASIAQEAQGLPFLLAAQQAPLLAPQSATSSDREFSIATNDVERALNDLSTSALTNDIIPEMQGWASTIRAAIADGSAAARQGLDPRMRDRVMGIRRQLGEYARLARFVGSLYPGMTQNFRRLGQALDEVAAVLLVMLGEALASIGFASGYFLLQVPFTELQARRDAVIYALRNFMGGAQQAYGPDDWPRGINAYRELFNRLEQQGQGDLRVLLTENEVAHIMDELISRAQNGSAEGLRALGVTAQLDIERFRRLAIVAPGARGSQNSPPLAAFLEALLLFADAFTPAGGLRLLRIARPPILFYGLYNAGLSGIDNDLLGIIALRGQLATLVDTLFLGSGTATLISQVLFDMLIAALDRIIDLLAMGVDGTDDVEIKQARALAYWLVIRAILSVLQPGIAAWRIDAAGNWSQPPNPTSMQIFAEGIPISFGNPLPPLAGNPPPQDLIASQFDDPNSLDPLRDSTPLRQEAQRMGGFNPPGFSAIARQFVDLFPTTIPLNAPHLRSRLTEELLIQKSLEKRWRELVRSVAPEAGRQQPVFNWLRLVIMQAISVLNDPTISGHRHTITWDQDEIIEGRFPAQFEQSLALIAHGRRP
jgi:hypothetical protein